MEHLTIATVIAGLLGIVATFLVRLGAAQRAKVKTPFSFSIWIAENWIDLTLGVIGTIAGIMFADTLTGIFGIDLTSENSYNAHAFICGLGGQFLISKLIKMANPDK